MTDPTPVSTSGSYGAAPERVGVWEPAWDEYMHYLYLPVKLAFKPAVRLPQRLAFIQPVLDQVMRREGRSPWGDHYVYVTARRGYATPGNPINRPGWHTDGFGTDDINYVWTDRWPTGFAVQDFGEISPDHVESAEQFDARVRPEHVIEYPVNTVLRLDPYVVHAAPEIEAPGGDRSFLKISFSKSKYNLIGNSHNYLLDYTWRMWSREEIRNDPAYAGGDSAPSAG